MKKSLLVFSLLYMYVFADTLTLQESIDKTLSNSPDLKSLELKITQSQKSYDISFADYLPQINVQAEYDFTQTYVLPSGGKFNTVDDDGWYVGANLKQKIWDFKKTSSKVGVSKIDENIAELSLEDMRALMVYKIKSLYKLIVVQKEDIEVRKKDLASKKAYYEQAKALVKQGLKTKADSSRFLSAYYAAQEKLAISQASFDKAEKSLSLYMGEEIKEDTTYETDVIKKKYAFEEFTMTEKEILTNNSQIKIDAQNVDKNILLYKSAKASHYGSVDAIASYKHLDTLNAYDSSIVGVTLEIPLYSGGRTTAEAQKAQIGIQVTKEQQASKILAIKEELSNLIIDIGRYDKTIESKQAQLLWANDTKDVLQGRYKEGLSTYMEVLDAESLALDAELGLLEAYYTKSVAIDRIDYLKGKAQ
ncbi:TolC family protein [Sulfurimonas sp.]|uniref:TolC family protein n=1 Tax=Sulfurimonas sp. TaxID=2022749 RepID=UPI00356401B7